MNPAHTPVEVANTVKKTTSTPLSKSKQNDSLNGRVNGTKARRTTENKQHHVRPKQKIHAESKVSNGNRFFYVGIDLSLIFIGHAQEVPRGVPRCLG